MAFSTGRQNFGKLGNCLCVQSLANHRPVLYYELLFGRGHPFDSTSVDCPVDEVSGVGVTRILAKDEKH